MGTVATATAPAWNESHLPIAFTHSTRHLVRDECTTNVAAATATVQPAAHKEPPEAVGNFDCVPIPPISSERVRVLRWFATLWML